MLESLAADESEQLLQLRNLRHSGTAKRLQWIVRKAAGSGVSAHDAAAIVGGEARVAHHARLHAAHAGAESIVFAHGASDDLLVIHAHILEEVLGQI